MAALGVWAAGAPKRAYTWAHIRAVVNGNKRDKCLVLCRYFVPLLFISSMQQPLAALLLLLMLEDTSKGSASCEDGRQLQLLLQLLTWWSFLSQPKRCLSGQSCCCSTNAMPSLLSLLLFCLRMLPIEVYHLRRRRALGRVLGYP